MTTLLRYPGGKTKLKSQILSKLKDVAGDQQLRYIEPFFGGGSIGCEFVKQNKDATSIWVNDFDSALVSLWRSVIDYPSSLKERVVEFVPSVSYFNEFKSVLSGNPTVPDNQELVVEYGFKKLALHQISYSGLGTKSGGPLGGQKQESKYKINCRWSPDYICKKIDVLHALFAGKTVKCTNYDFEVPIADNFVKSLIYLDPPYYVKGPDLYECSFDKAAHERLSVLLRRTSHLWVLSYDDSPQIRKMYDWAVIQELPVKYSIAMNKDERIENTMQCECELLITNC